MRKKYEDLSIIDNFMINAMATDPEMAEPAFRVMLSVLLQRKINRVSVTAERFVPGMLPGQRGVRLDVEVEEYETNPENGEIVTTNVYDLEPHLNKDMDFPRMMRFRQARIDSSKLKANEKDYAKLPDLFIILITDFDLFGKDQMVYTFRQSCTEIPEIDYKDGLRLLYFNTKGKGGGSNAIRNMLEYIENSRKDAAVDDATKELNRYVEDIKQNALLKGEYMTLGYLIDCERAEEREEVTKEVRLASIIELLEDVGPISEELRERLGKETEDDRFKFLLKLAARVSSIEEFEEKYDGQ